MDLGGGQGLHVPPLSARPGTGTSKVKPQTHRYLQESALGLADDSARFYAGFHHDKLTPIPDKRLSTPRIQTPMTPSTASNYRPSTGDTVTSVQPTRAASWNDAANEKLMANAFVSEAAECIRSLQAVFDTANMTTFASRFEDWRKVDLRATAQMQMHVKTLNQLNESVEHFLTRSATPDEFKNFYGSMQTLSGSIDVLNELNTELKDTTDRIARRASEYAFHFWKSEWHSLSSKLQTTLDSHLEKQEELCARQTDMYSRFDRLEAITSKISSELVEQREHNNRMAALQQRLAESGDSTKQLTQDTLDELLKASGPGGWQEQFQKKLEQSGERVASVLKSHFADVLGGGNSGGLLKPSVGEAMSQLEARMQSWEIAASKDVLEWREKASQLQNSLRDSNREMENTSSSRDQVMDVMHDLELQVKEMQAELARMQGCLTDAQQVSMHNGMKLLNDIEQRGSASMNRTTGEVKVMKALKFVEPGKNDKNPPAELAEPESAEEVFQDLAKIVKLLDDMPLELQVTSKMAKNGNRLVFEEMSKNRAELIKEGIAQQGISVDHVEVKGAVGKNDEVILQFDREVFSSPASSGSKKR